MESFKIKGKLFKIYPTENKTGSFQTREFVITVDDRNYQQYIKFQLTQDRCGAVDAFKEGTEVEVHFDLRGREWQGKYFTNLNAWRITVVNQANTPVYDLQENNFPGTPVSEEQNLQAEDFDDRPF